MVDPNWLAATRLANQKAVGLAGHPLGVGGLGFASDLTATMQARSSTVAQRAVRQEEERQEALAATRRPPPSDAGRFVLDAPAVNPITKYMMIAALVVAAIGLAVVVKKRMGR